MKAKIPPPNRGHVSPLRPTMLGLRQMIAARYGAEVIHPNALAGILGFGSTSAMNGHLQVDRPRPFLGSKLAGHKVRLAKMAAIVAGAESAPAGVEWLDPAADAPAFLAYWRATGMTIERHRAAEDPDPAPADPAPAVPLPLAAGSDTTAAPQVGDQLKLPEPGRTGPPQVDPSATRVAFLMGQAETNRLLRQLVGITGKLLMVTEKAWGERLETADPPGINPATTTTEQEDTH